MATNHSTNVIDLTGKRFGRLLVLRREGRRGKRITWLCECDCGALHVVAGANLRSGGTTSCRSCAYKRMGKIRSTHGMSKSREHHCWSMMKQRCCNPRCKSYLSYGGRGIAVCPRWLESFEAFFADMGEAPPGASLDRIDNDGDYEPSNCRWADVRTQGSNRRTSRRLYARGESLTVAEWARRLGCPTTTIWSRLKAGDSAEDALFGKHHRGRRRKAQVP